MTAALRIMAAAGWRSQLRWVQEEMLGRFSDRWTVWATAGYVLAELDTDLGQAVAIAGQAPRLQPQLGHAWLAFGTVLLRARWLQPAIMALETAWGLLPDDAVALRVETAVALSLCHLALADCDQSSRWSAAALRRLPGLEAIDPAMHHYWKARICESIGDTLGAACAFRNALRAQLTFPQRARALAACGRSIRRGERGEGAERRRIRAGGG
jgi:tetratricopeptide (TPR) repeat protein